MVDSQVEDMILEQSSFDKMATDLENQELEVIFIISLKTLSNVM